MSESPRKFFKESLAVVVDDLRTMNQQTIESARQLTDKATNLLQWSSVALVVASAVQAASAARLYITPLFILGVALVLYFVLVLFSLRAIWPQDYEQPIEINWDELYTLYMGRPETDCLKQMVSQYIAAIAFNSDRSAAKARWVHWGFALFPFLIVALMLLATHGLWQNMFV